MQRRDLLRVLGGAAAASILAPLGAEQRLLLGRRLHAMTAPGAFAPAQAALVAELAELILPRTDTPGALDAGVPAFIDRVVAFWDTAAERDRLLAGLEAIEVRARALGAPTFAALPPGPKADLLTALDAATAPVAGSAEEAWVRLKRLVVYGYFTSQVVREDVLHSVIIPGRYEGCVPVEG